MYITLGIHNYLTCRGTVFYGPLCMCFQFALCEIVVVECYAVVH